MNRQSRWYHNLPEFGSEEPEEDSLQDQLIQELEDRATPDPASVMSTGMGYFGVSMQNSSQPQFQPQWQNSPSSRPKPPDDYSSWTEYLLHERDQIVKGMKKRWDKK